MNDKKLKPRLKISRNAYEQIRLIKENDFYLAKKSFRVQISGKGCDGFEYSTAFTEKDKNDVVLKFKDFQVLMDSFTAFYLIESKLDYMYDEEADSDGFVVTNERQSLFEGKFWKDSPELIPPTPQAK